jgi:hypothetical protein
MLQCANSYEIILKSIDLTELVGLLSVFIETSSRRYIGLRNVMGKNERCK